MHYSIGDTIKFKPQFLSQPAIAKVADTAVVSLTETEPEYYRVVNGQLDIWIHKQHVFDDTMQPVTTLNDLYC